MTEDALGGHLYGRGTTEERWTCEGCGATATSTDIVEHCFEPKVCPAATKSPESEID